MSMNYDKEINLKGLEVRLMAQKGSLMSCETEVLKFRQQIEKYEETMISLSKEIEITESMIKKLKGGE